MAGDAEATRKLRVSTEIASLEFEDLAASIAAEMMMMCLTGNLVSQGFTRHRDGCEPIPLEQRTNVAVDGSDAQPLDLSLSCGQHLFRREWTIGPEKSFPNRRFLTRVARLCRQVFAPD